MAGAGAGLATRMQESQGGCWKGAQLSLREFLGSPRLHECTSLSPQVISRHNLFPFELPVGLRSAGASPGGISGAFRAKHPLHFPGRQHRDAPLPLCLQSLSGLSLVEHFWGLLGTSLIISCGEKPSRHVEVSIPCMFPYPALLLGIGKSFLRDALGTPWHRWELLLGRCRE